MLVKSAQQGRAPLRDHPGDCYRDTPAVAVEAWPHWHHQISQVTGLMALRGNQLSNADLTKIIEILSATLSEIKNCKEPDQIKNENEPVTYNRGNKFDVQLSAAKVRERALGEIFLHAIFDGTEDVKMELKSETFQWEQTGNICVEYRQNGEPSGIAVTKANVWVHELRRKGETLCWLMFPIERLKELARQAYREGRYHEGGGDGGRFSNVLISLSEILS